MDNINDRLERFDRREELARRVQGRTAPAVPAVRLDDDFVEVLDAVARVVGRHPGLSVLVATADGRKARRVIRVTEHSGAVEIAVVPPPGAAQPVQAPESPDPTPVPHPRDPVPAAIPAPPAPARVPDRRDAGPDPVPGPPAPPPYARPYATRLPGPSGPDGPPSGFRAMPGPAAGAGRHAQPPPAPDGPAEPESTAARLARMLREDPSLVDGWRRDGG